MEHRHLTKFGKGLISLSIIFFLLGLGGIIVGGILKKGYLVLIILGVLFVVLCLACIVYGIIFVWLTNSCVCEDCKKELKDENETELVEEKEDKQIITQEKETTDTKKSTTSKKTNTKKNTKNVSLK